MHGGAERIKKMFSLGTRYSFRGPDINASANQVIDKAQNKAASVVKVECQVE